MSAFENHSIPERLHYWTKKHPDTEAFVFIDKDGLRSVLTCQEVLDQALDFAKHLRNIGLEPGDVVCSMLPDSPNGLIALFGILTAGGVVQNATLHLSDGSFVITNLNTSKCRALILSSDENDERRRVFSPHFDFNGGHEVSSKTIPHVTKIIFTRENGQLGFKWLSDIGDQETIGTDDALWKDQHSDAIIFLTSGTTGMFKMVVHSDESILCYADVLHHIFLLDKFIGVLNYHSFSWAGGFPIYFLATGRKRILIDQRNPPSSDDFYGFLNSIIEQEELDAILFSVSSVLKLVEHVKSHPSSKGWTLPICLIAGSPLSKRALEIMKPFFTTIYNLYGSTEANYVSFKEINSSEEFENFNAGKPVIGAHVKIVDESNSVLPHGETGRIKVKSKGRFKKYLGNEELTKAVFDDDGYLDMEDVGYINWWGEIISFGRTKEVIMKGENYFHPSWIETVIRSCSEVYDVLVVKVPDDTLLNEICACVVLVAGSQASEQELEQMCKNKFAQDDSAHKSACPGYFIIIDKIPLNANGKPDRKCVESYAIEHLNLNRKVTYT